MNDLRGQTFIDASTRLDTSGIYPVVVKANEVDDICDSNMRFINYARDGPVKSKIKG